MSTSSKGAWSSDCGSVMNPRDAGVFWRPTPPVGFAQTPRSGRSRHVAAATKRLLVSAPETQSPAGAELDAKRCCGRYVCRV